MAIETIETMPSTEDEQAERIAELEKEIAKLREQTAEQNLKIEKLQEQILYLTHQIPSGGMVRAKINEMAIRKTQEPK